MRELRLIVCNYVATAKMASKGALCYVLNANPGHGGDRILVLLRSRGGRWISKWEARSNLTNFRVKIVVPESPLYPKLAQATPAEHATWLLAKPGSGSGGANP